MVSSSEEDGTDDWKPTQDESEDDSEEEEEQVGQGMICHKPAVAESWQQAEQCIVWWEVDVGAGQRQVQQGGARGSRVRVWLRWSVGGSVVGRLRSYVLSHQHFGCPN